MQHNTDINFAREYHNYFYALRITRAKLAFIFAIIFVPLGILFDFFVYPDFVWDILLIRVTCSILLVLLYKLLCSEFGKRFSVIITIASAIIIGLSIIMMTVITEGYKSPYYAGLILILIAYAVVLPWNIKETLIASGSLYLLYVVTTLLTSHIDDMGIFVNNNYFLLFTTVMVLVSSVLNTRLRDQEFYSRYKLDVANKELSKLDELKSQFFSNVSHELRTPLTGIIAPLESMNRSANVEGNVCVSSPDLRSMTLNAKKLLKLINDILDFSKLEAGKMVTSCRKVDLMIMLSEIGESVLPMAREKNIAFSIKDERGAGSGRPVELYLDPSKVDKIFLNLVSNALKFTPEGGRITIRIIDDQFRVFVSVEDTGIGIPEDQLNHIFERFHQVDGSSTRSYGGTGIGLNLVKELVELHKGSITVKSELNKGSSFKVALLKGTAHINKENLLENVEETSSSKPSRVGVERRNLERRQDDRRYNNPHSVQLADLQVDQTAKKKLIEELAKDEQACVPKKEALIQIVDDDATIAGLIRNALKDLYNVKIAFDGEEGWSSINRDIPDLVISDLMMPKLNGYELTTRIKSGEHTRHIPVIILTAKGEMSFKIEGLEMGADDYLSKPFNQDELKARVKSLLNARNLEIELGKTNVRLERALKELKETQAQLMQTEKTKTTSILLMGLTHEMNNPINHALNGIRYAIKKTKQGEVSRKDAEDIYEMQELAERNIELLANLLSEFKKYSRNETLTIEKLNLLKAVNTTLKLLKMAIGERVEVSVTNEFDGEIECIPGQINQVLMNITKNALDAIPEKGKINISIKKYSESEVAVSVADSGGGMTDEVKKKIFEPFYTTKGPDKGTGLGLYLCQKIVMEHKGRIEVESVLGCGTTMSVILPIKQQTLATA